MKSTCFRVAVLLYESYRLVIKDFTQCQHPSVQPVQKNQWCRKYLMIGPAVAFKQWTSLFPKQQIISFEKNLEHFGVAMVVPTGAVPTPLKIDRKYQVESDLRDNLKRTHLAITNKRGIQGHTGPSNENGLKKLN